MAADRAVAVALADLAQAGYAVVEEFLAPPVVHALAREFEGLLAAGKVRAAALGTRRERDPHRRGDQICWLDSAPRSAPEACYQDAMTALRIALNRGLFLNLAEIESHFACYAPGTVYARHVDITGEGCPRVLSCSLYLNDGWSAGYGGALRLYAPDGAVEILPLGGRLVVFDSTLEHEVLPATRPRLSLTGWLRRAPVLPGL